MAFSAPADDKVVGKHLPVTPRTLPPTPYNRAVAAVQQSVGERKKDFPLVAPRWIGPQEPIEDQEAKTKRSSTAPSPTDDVLAVDHPETRMTPQLATTPVVAEEVDDLLVEAQDPEPKRKRQEAQLTSLEAHNITQEDADARPPPKKLKKHFRPPTDLGTSGKSLLEIINAVDKRNLKSSTSARADLLTRSDHPRQSPTIDQFSIPGYLQSLQRPNLAHASPRPTSQPKADVSDLTDSLPSWTINPAIKNPNWYENAALSVTRQSRPVAVLASINLLQERSVIRSLEERGFDIVERDSRIQEADLVLSASTAVLFRKLATLPDELVPLIRSLKLATVYYQRVFVVLEVVSFAITHNGTNDSRSVDPLRTPILKSLSAFRRRLALSLVPGENDVIGSVDLLFASNGPAEVAQVLRTIMEKDCDRLSHVAGHESTELCGPRAWLSNDDVSIACLLLIYLSDPLNRLKMRRPLRTSTGSTASLRSTFFTVSARYWRWQSGSARMNRMCRS